MSVRSIVTLVLVAAAGSAAASTYYLKGDDPAGQSSFVTNVASAGWSSGAAPVAAHHYYVSSGRTLRSPSDTKSSTRHAFPGKSLEITGSSKLYVATRLPATLDLGSDFRLTKGKWGTQNGWDGGGTWNGEFYGTVAIGATSADKAVIDTVLRGTWKYHTTFTGSADKAYRLFVNADRDSFYTGGKASYLRSNSYEMTIVLDGDSSAYYGLTEVRSLINLRLDSATDFGGRFLLQNATQLSVMSAANGAQTIAGGIESSDGYVNIGANQSLAVGSYTSYFAPANTIAIWNSSLKRTENIYTGTTWDPSYVRTHAMTWCSAYVNTLKLAANASFSATTANLSGTLLDLASGANVTVGSLTASNACLAVNDALVTVTNSLTLTGPLKKTGTGTLRLASGGTDGYAGRVNVENGAFVTDTATVRGTGDQSVCLGSSDAVGTFTYDGASAATVTGRPLVVTGLGGRLGADGGRLDWTGFSSETNTTLYLAGDSSATNVARDVAGPVSVVKEGDTTWILEGDNAFAGSLTVDGGTLVAYGDLSEKNNFDFRWFKFQIRGRISREADYGNELQEFAFHDANGVRQLDGFTFVKTYTTGSGSSVKIPDLSNIQPGEYGWLKAATTGTYGYMTNRDADKLFDDDTALEKCGMCVNSGILAVPENPDTWMELLVRLPTAMTQIAAFDFVATANYAEKREVTHWTVLGSEDGHIWRTLKTYDSDTIVPGGYWFSDKTLFASGQNRKGKGYTASAIEDGASTVGRLSQVTKATVRTGGTLRVVGKADFPVVEMAGGTFVIDAGTTNSYGQLIVSGDGSKMTIPDGSSVTFGDSTALTWPSEGHLDITTEGDGSVAFEGLTLAQREQITVNGVALDAEAAEKIAFLGDGITGDGFYEYFLQDFESTRHPGKVIRLLNCGAAGDTAASALARLEADVLARKPDRVAILLGMNDVGLSNYCENPTAEQLSAQARSLETFAQNLTSLVDRIAAYRIDVTLVTPTPYDEYSESNETFVAATNYRTANEKGLAAIAKIVRDLANARGLTLLDLHAPMTEIYRTSPTHFNRADRVHPEESGHALMSLIVWKQFGYDANPYSDQTICAGGGYICTNYVAGGLPFAAVESLDTAKTAVPADYAQMNREIIRFTDIPDATYTLSAGGASLGTYTAAELKSGIDLAQKATPSHEQSAAAWAKMKSLIGAREEDAVVRWRELRHLGTPQPYALELKRQGIVEIPPNQGNVELSVDTLTSASSIYIGTNSCLVVKTANTEATTIDIPGAICGPGDWFIWGSYVNIRGDNRGFMGRKTFTNAFVTVSSRYGLGSPTRELKNYVEDANHGWYLRFAGNGLTNDVPVCAYGAYCPAEPAAGLTADAAYPLVMNGGFCAQSALSFYLGDYEFAGGLCGANDCWFAVRPGCDAWITGPFKLTGDNNLPLSDGRLHLKAHPDSTRWPIWLYPRGSAKIICESEDVSPENLALGYHGGLQSASAGTFDMNGHDQTFKRVTFCNDETSVQKGWTDLRLYVTSALPATLTMSIGSANRQGIRFAGAAGLRFTGADAWTNVLFRSETTGTLTVGDGTNAGEVFFDWGASWGGNVVLDGGRFGCDTSQGLSYRAEIAISNGGQLIVPKGVRLRVAKVIVDGIPLVNGTYQNVPWISGGGSVQCGRVGFMMILRKPR